MIGQCRGQGQRRRSTADRRGATGEHAEQALETQGLGRDHRDADGHHHEDHHQQHRFPAERGNLFEGDAHAQQGHADAQHGARGEFDAGLANAFAREKVQGHTQQQGKQHYRSAVVLGEKRRRGGNGQADDKARRQFARTALNLGQGDGAHGAASSGTITM
ncbi:hypothetical protein D9M71_333920 [compost metagenome]